MTVVGQDPGDETPSCSCGEPHVSARVIHHKDRACHLDRRVGPGFPVLFARSMAPQYQRAGSLPLVHDERKPVPIPPRIDESTIICGHCGEPFGFHVRVQSVGYMIENPSICPRYLFTKLRMDDDSEDG